ncbi:carbon-nitrogen hydrolase family protein [bacterium]|nr:carbon-nitrogen hydrolase family protein [bacterium]
MLQTKPDREHCLRLAVAQIPLSASVERNCSVMLHWMERARAAGADLVQFPETALTGYHGVHLGSMGQIDRESLENCNLSLRAAASRLRLWLAYGSTHFESWPDKPFNCLYLVNPHGATVARYDKVFLTDTDSLAYTPGRDLVLARIGAFRVGLSICFDMRFPELFRRYMLAGADLVLVSSFQSGGDRAAHMRTVAPSTLVTRASENGMWLACSNTSERPSWHEAMVIAYNGVVKARAHRHRASLAVADLDSRDCEPFTSYIRRSAQGLAQAGGGASLGLVEVG